MIIDLTAPLIRVHQAGRPGVWVRTLVTAHGGYFGRLERADKTPLPATEDRSGLPTVPDCGYQLTRIPAGDQILECRHCHGDVGPPGIGADRLVQRRCTLMILGGWVDLWADHAGISRSSLNGRASSPPITRASTKSLGGSVRIPYSWAMITPKQHEVLHSMSPEAMELMMKVSNAIADSGDLAESAGECLAALVLTMPVEDQQLFAASARRFAEILGV